MSTSTPIISVLIPVAGRDVVSRSVTAALLDAGYSALDIVFAVRAGSPNARLADDPPEGCRVLQYVDSIEEIASRLLGEWLCVLPAGGHVRHGFFNALLNGAGPADGAVSVTMHLTPGAGIHVAPRTATLSIEDLHGYATPVGVMIRRLVAPRFVGGSAELFVWRASAIAVLGAATVADAARLMMVGETGLVGSLPVDGLDLAICELALDQATGDAIVDGATMRFCREALARAMAPQAAATQRWLANLQRSFPVLVNAA